MLSSIITLIGDSWHLNLQRILGTDRFLLQVVYKRYASLYFVVGIDTSDNELITLEIIHHFVEVLDRYFGNVCELDLIFNFHKVRTPSRQPVSLVRRCRAKVMTATMPPPFGC